MHAASAAGDQVRHRLGCAGRNFGSGCFFTALGCRSKIGSVPGNSNCNTWVRQWQNEVDPVFGHSAARDGYLAFQRKRHGISERAGVAQSRKTSLAEVATRARSSHVSSCPGSGQEMTRSC